MNYTLRHVDTCLPCFLNDHHARIGEKLLAVPVTGSTRVHDVLAGVRDELQDHEFPVGFSYEAAEEAIKSAFHGAHRFAVWDPTLDKMDVTRDDLVYAYFVLSYDLDREVLARAQGWNLDDDNGYKVIRRQATSLERLMNNDQAYIHANSWQQACEIDLLTD